MLDEDGMRDPEVGGLRSHWQGGSGRGRLCETDVGVVGLHWHSLRTGERGDSRFVEVSEGEADFGWGQRRQEA